MTIKSTTLSLPLIFLLACGGGDDGLVTTDIPKSTQSGTFLSTMDEGVTQFPSAFEAAGFNAQECRDQQELKVFESPRVRVFGVPSLPDNDFRLIAEYTEANLSEVLAAFNLSYEEFLNKRPVATISGAERVIGALVDGVFDGEYDEYNQPVFTSLFDVTELIQRPENWEQMNSNDQFAWVGRYFYRATRVQQIALVDAYHEMNDNEFGRVDMLDEKLYVCMTSAGDIKFGYGEGSVAGINVLAPSSGFRKDTRKVLLHEAVHTVQANMSTPIGGMALQRWYAEGQAVFIADQQIAKPSDASEFNPVEMKTFIDEVPGFDAYPYYGLAYQYVHEQTGYNGALALFDECRNEFFYDSSLYMERPELIGSGEIICFPIGFDETSIDPHGEPLTLEDYRLNWETRMQAYQE